MRKAVARHLADTGLVHTCFLRHRSKTPSGTGGHRRYLTSDVGRRGSGGAKRSTSASIS